MPSSKTAAFPRSFRKSYPIAARGEGVYLYTAEGNRYLDFDGSAAVNFTGHGVRAIADAIATQAAQLEFVHSSHFTTALAETFARELLGFAGEGFRGGAVYFTSGGSEAIETALKLARQYQVEVGQEQRTRFISRSQSYHGATLGAVGVSGNPRRREMYLPLVADSLKVSTPYCYRCAYDCKTCESKSEVGCETCGAKYAAELSRLLGTHGKEAAAFLFEPISGATLGAVAPPPGYLEQVTKLCREHGVLTITDEVMTGCGRTGRNFAVEHYNVTPDILVTAKGLASGYAPLGAVIASARVVVAIAAGSGAFAHGLTYNAHPVALAAGHAVQQQVIKGKLVARAAAAGKTMQSSLGQLHSLRTVGDVRGIGLLWAIEFVADKITKAPFPADKTYSTRVAEACFHRGLLVYPMQGCADGYAGDHILIAPPAIITDQEIAWAANELLAAIEEVENTL
jgi:adenosylmethionine-8-amino-7-oxononanoate aminotransferase